MELIRYKVKDNTVMGVLVGAGRMWLRYYDKKRNKTFASAAAINYCPMCGHDLRKEPK